MSLRKSSHFATILGYAFKLPARSLTVAALLVLRRRHTAYGCGYVALRPCGEGPSLHIL
ncbi:MAG: hypothetical protein ACR2L2_17720 [Acidobacteriota bacterium]